MKQIFEQIKKQINSCRGYVCNVISCNDCKYVDECTEGEHTEDKALDMAIEAVKEIEAEYKHVTKNVTKAIVAGSFDPFTNGHLELVRKAAKMFDEVIVVIGVNAKKTRKYDVYKMRDAINKTLQNEGLTNCVAEYVEGPIAIYCFIHKIKYTVRGLRNNMDFNYESEIAKTNKLIYPSLETVYLPSDSDVISSSLVREFLDYDLPVDRFVPEEVLASLLEERD